MTSPEEKDNVSVFVSISTHLCSQIYTQTCWHFTGCQFIQLTKVAKNTKDGVNVTCHFLVAEDSPLPLLSDSQNTQWDAWQVS